VQQHYCPTAIHAALPKQGAMAYFKKGEVSMADLRNVGRVTGDEYSMYTKGSQRFVIRGVGNEVRVPTAAMAEALRNGEYGKWSGHTHPPGYSLNPGPGDAPNIPINQTRSDIWADEGNKFFYKDVKAERAQRSAEFRKLYGDE
jgi:hypothetical protein